MQKTVTRLKPRIADYSLAAQAFLNGNFLFCVDALSENLHPAAVALHGRALIRLGRYSDAISTVDRLDITDLQHQYAAELLAVRAMAMISLRDECIEAVMTEARARAYSSGYIPVECEIEYIAAMVAWSSGRLAEADDAVDLVLQLCDTTNPAFVGKLRTDYLYAPAFWRARAHELRGLIQAGREDYLGQAASLILAFSEFDSAQVNDVSVELHMLRNMAVIARDVESNAVAEFVEARAACVNWTEHTAAAEFATYRCIGWNHAIAGDHLGAFRQFRHSAACAPSIPLQIEAIVDRAFIARELGEHISAQDDLEHALRLSKQVDWEHTPASDRMALFNLARVLAPTDIISAESLWNRYLGVKPSMPILENAARGDRRLRGFECFAHAAIHRANGDNGRAISLLLECLEIFSEVGYAWRAAAAALELFELTEEPRYYDIVAREAAKRPNSWFARRLSNLKALQTV